MLPEPPFTAPSKMPLPVMLLGAAASFPLTTLAGMIVMGITVPGIDNTFALMVYGAIVLTFMSGVLWGLAMIMPGHGAPGRWGHSSEWRRYLVSFAPALCAWVGLLLPLKAGALVMAGGFIAMLIYDLHCTRVGEAPSWFPALRWPLVIMAVGSLIVGIVLAGR